MKFKKEQSQKDKRTAEPCSTLNISTDINKNISKIKNDFDRCSELEISFFKYHYKKDIICAYLYINSLVDRSSINSISLQLTKTNSDFCTMGSETSFSSLKDSFSGLRFSKEGFDYDTLYLDLLSGGVVFLVDGWSRYFCIDISDNEGRSVDEPSSQTVIRGPKDGFVENINTNIMLIRKRMKSRALKMEKLYVGSISRTTVCLMYINGIAKDETVQEIKTRIGKIEIDGILEGGYIEELIKDDRYSIFPTFLSSEKPDSVAAALLEGRVAILVEGTPYVLTAPALMVEFLQSSEDYYHHFIISSLVRLLRYVAFSLTLLVPATYVAVTTFHQEMIPTQLLMSIAAQREGVPFPALLEALLMEITFEILREAGIRMPRAIGPAISIVGALVLGQAGVEAGIVSAAMVIVVSITAISSFAIPNYEMSNAVRVVRFVLMLLAGVLGLYGVFMGLIILVLHLCKIKSVSVPYLTPVAPKIKGGNKDTFFRFPLWKMRERPGGISDNNTARVNGKSIVGLSQKGKRELR